MPSILADLHAIRRRLNECGWDNLADELVVRPCRDADREHARSPRSFAHCDTEHGEQFTVCIAVALNRQPDTVRQGILWHEIGHLMDDYFAPPPEFGVERVVPASWRQQAERVYGRDNPRVPEEARANYAVFNEVGVRIGYNGDNVDNVQVVEGREPNQDGVAWGAALAADQ
jgi:hypothetical protein